MATIELPDLGLVRNYPQQGPRYTSYPTALEMHTDFSLSDWQQGLAQSTQRHLGIYLHIPFCHSLCYYCGCNKIVTRQQQKADEYVQVLLREISFRANYFGLHKVSQIHFGGGTPSFLSADQLALILQRIKERFDLADQLEISIEIDPRRLPDNYLSDLAAIGVNRISMGVQDTQRDVQIAINRVQDTTLIANLIEQAREANMHSVNLDLVYGLPYQTETGFAATLSDVIAMDPDRISLFSYAHMPQRFAAQRKIKSATLPDAEAKLALMQQAITTLTHAGYQFIGMDHFAKPHDPLSKAWREDRVHRNFQGYTTFNGDLLGMGVSAISQLGTGLSQNAKQLSEYYARMDNHQQATERGYLLNEDDRVRAAVISDLMCKLRVNKQAFNNKFGLDFDQYFEQELEKLTPYIMDGWVTNSQDQLIIQPNARLLVRLACMAFDRYLQQHVPSQRFSQVV